MISDRIPVLWGMMGCMVESWKPRELRDRTVIEVARRAAGLSQRRLAEIARTQQSSVSEYESRRKSPTLEVTERLVDAADAKLTVTPLVVWDYLEDLEGVGDPQVGVIFFPDRLWSVPVPDCFARVQVIRRLLGMGENTIWDLSDPGQRVAFYERVLVRGLPEQMEDSVDGVLLVQAWPALELPEVVRRVWQPAIDAATPSPDRLPRDPGGVSAKLAAGVGIRWPPPAPRGSSRGRGGGGRRRPSAG
jgi:transcriptional regulator with XRE-family HTH domain